MVTVDPAADDLEHALDHELVDWFATIGGTVVGVGGESTDLVDWFEGHDVRWALQRPDFHLFGTASDASSAQAMLADLRRRLDPAAVRAESHAGTHAD